MEKTILIDGKETKFKTSGAIPKRYKMQFGRDFFKDLLSMAPTQKTGKKEEINVYDINFEVFYDIAWTLAKTADSSVSDPLSWLDSFEEFPIMEILPEIQDMLTATISTTKKK